MSSLLSGLQASVLARLVLLANHVVSGEEAAVLRLKPLAGRRIDLLLRPPASVPLLGRWIPQEPLALTLTITPAGLFEQGVPHDALPPADGLKVTVDLPPPHEALRLMLQRQRPDVRIEGDAQLAEAVSWLMKNLRWDLEDEVARLIGMPPAAALKGVAGAVREALSRMLAAVPRPGRR